VASPCPPPCPRCAGTAFGGFELRPASYLDPFRQHVVVAVPCPACGGSGRAEPDAGAILGTPAHRSEVRCG
jgi:hypothetical protein